MEYVHGGDIYTHKGVLDFSVNVNPFGPGRRVVEAAQDSMKMIGHYPDYDCRKLRRSLAEELGVPEEHLIFGNGAADLIFTAVWAQHPKKAIIPVPAFTEYEKALEAADCEVLYYKKKEETGFALEEDFLDFLDEDVDMVFLCSPDNPTGKLIPRALLWKILARCETYGIRMAVDESFIDFVENAETASILADTKRWRMLFILRSFTKMHAVPGLRLGYAVSSDLPFIEKMETVRQPWSVSVPAQAAGIAALHEKQRVRTTCDFTSRERRWMQKELDKIGIQYFESDANYLLIKSGLDLSALLLEKNILIRDCGNYAGLGKGYYRIAMRQRGDNQKLLEALYEILEIEPPRRKVQKRSPQKAAMLRKKVELEPKAAAVHKEMSGEDAGED